VAAGSRSIAVLCHAGPGGSTHVATRLAGALGERGHRVALVAEAPPRVPAARLASVALEPLRSRDGGGWSTALEQTWGQRRLELLERHIESVVRRHGTTVLHYHYAWPFAGIVRRLKRRLGAAAPQFVCTLHGTDVTRPPDDADLGTLADTDAYTTVSHAYAALATERLGLPEAPAVIPNFVDAASCPRSSDFGQYGRRPRLIHVSSFRPVKDPDAVADIFASVRRCVDAELWLVGDGPGLPALRDRLRLAGLEQHVRLFGYRADVLDLLRCCDVLVMTSREESFGLAALEAMGCGLAVVGTAVGGFAELVGDSDSALLYPPGDHPAGARRVLEVLGDRELRLRMGHAALARARAFSVANAVERYEALYDSLNSPAARKSCALR
jgi:N-acetyl-alpha-D-glucosaminyl L-malate synthase BshA